MIFFNHALYLSIPLTFNIKHIHMLMRLVRATCIFIFFALITQTISAQKKVTIKGIFKNGELKSATLSYVTKGFSYDYLKEGEIEAKVVSNRFAFDVFINEPQVLYLYLETDSAWFYQPLYLAENYKLNLECTLLGSELKIQTTGVGAPDNQRLLLEKATDITLLNNRKDTLPYEIFDELKKMQLADSLQLENYIQQHLPSTSFIQTWRYHVRYSFLNNFYSVAEARKFAVPNAYYRNIKSWDSIKNHLLVTYGISNDDALKSTAPSYYSFIKRFLLRMKERLWWEAETRKKDFYNEWYHTDIEQGMLQLTADRYNLVKQKIINKYFTGNTKEYMYGVLFDEALGSADPANLQMIYQKFIKEYPNSTYIGLYENALQTFFAKTNNQLTDKMIFINQSDTLTTLQQVVALFKGKTVLLDMWGTWCGPCREEIEKHGEAIKNHFENKGLDYLYIANFDLGNEKKWKELIAFFKLEGHHIIANEKLSTHIMSSLKTSGYPTYAIIRSDGTIELSKAGYPMNRELLIQQIEKLLTKAY